MKISLITVTFNAARTIQACIESVIAQDYKNIEYIFIDGGSTDDTLAIASLYRSSIDYLITGPDRGIYDAINKGIALATGEIVGLLNADDVFAANDILSVVVRAFEGKQVKIVYGDLDYVRQDGTIIRKWRSGEMKAGSFDRGWMPPHPTFYCRRGLFDQYGVYSLDHGTAADYELMLRYLHVYRLPSAYLPVVMVKMRTGGASNNSLGSRLKALGNDYKAMRSNKIKWPWLALLFKPLRKIKQFF
ncbi:glycosyltransferase [Mucilaginibacter corticis]|uniref:Glycosyltransferase n=1 Tax=Mucilaginibacter corticis TaxID=2597670 RepID=A0A556MBZ1_9SPHI|nr:glycosyltransferase family 2 protein [Mucilaginibacter corticis]TSJ37382.1 glycosyltransferase [Mucilaginibacter corticis]